MARGVTPINIAMQYLCITSLHEILFKRHLLIFIYLWLGFGYIVYKNVLLKLHKMPVIEW